MSINSRPVANMKIPEIVKCFKSYSQSNYGEGEQRYTDDELTNKNQTKQRTTEHDKENQRIPTHPKDDTLSPVTLGEVCIVLMESVQYVELQGMNFQNALIEDIIEAFSFLNFDLELLQCENGMEPYTIKCRLAMKSLLQMDAGHSMCHL
eukprot:764539-Hanusia_phi.AAC.2